MSERTVAIALKTFVGVDWQVPAKVARVDRKEFSAYFRTSKTEAQATPQRLITSTSPIRGSLEVIGQARRYSQAATPIVYVAFKLMDKKRNVPSENDKGGDDYE
jgi:hypothetical protein